MSTERAKRTFLADYRPPPFSVPSVDLHFHLHENNTQVRSKLTVTRNSNTGIKEPFFLNGVNLELVSIELNGKSLEESDYVLGDQGISIFNPPDEFELKICNSIDPSRNLALSGMYMSSNILCTQCEAEGFRNITFFPDRPDILSCYSVTIEAEKRSFPVLLSNGEMVEHGDLPGGDHYTTWRDPHPKPCYLFALVAGDLAVLEDEFITCANRRVKLDFYVTKKHLDKCRHAMECLKRAMDWDERVYGREYDLNRYMIVAVDHFNMGAMENKGLNIFNSKYVYAKPETATDQDFHAIESVIAHEYFHNWSGNRVTLRDWFQLSLKEGFTIFRDQQFSADMGSSAVQRIHDVNLVKLHQFREDASPKRHAVQPDSYLTIDNFYNITVYNKGAELIRMLYLLLGPEKYRSATDLYFERYDGCAVTVEEFVMCMEQASGLDLLQFRRWYHVAGTPKVHVERHYDSRSRTFQLTLEQSPPDKTSGKPGKPMHIPIECALLDKKGKRMSLALDSDPATVADEFLLELKTMKQTFNFVEVSHEPVLSLLRGFSAPILIEDPKADDQLHFILSHDDDAFCRWDAWQRISKAELLRLVTEIKSGQEPRIDENFFSAYGAVLDSALTDPQFSVLLLEPPTEISIAQAMDVIDPSAIHQARKLLIRSIAERFFERFVNMYLNLAPLPDLSPKAVGERSLRNLFLNMLVELETEVVHQMAIDQFNHSTNMTDLVASLKALVSSNSSFRETALETFYDNWKEDSGVVDKWFRIQATVVRDDTLNNVIRLSSHQSFSFHTPNRVYSLIGAFCHANPYCFHAADGGGYELLKNNVLNIDKYNPQGAAQLADAFSEIHRYDEGRQAAMYQRLEEIAASKNISVNAFEIVDRILKSRDQQFA